VFQGLRTAIYHVDDIRAAKGWYSAVLGFGPYFDEPFYVGFNVGGYELGLQPREGGGSAAAGTRPSVVAYWGVASARDSLKRLLELGARPHGDVQDVGGGILVATVLDPSGNVFGIIENPHFSVEGR
jgi:predicted enzyme related to lactoylglutathione lyase